MRTKNKILVRFEIVVFKKKGKDLGPCAKPLNKALEKVESQNKSEQFQW